MEDSFNSHKNISFAYLSAIIFSVLVIFSFVLVIENFEKRITGNLIEDNTINNKTDENFEEKGELYSTDSYVMFYMIIIGVIAFIFIVSLILKSTIENNIKNEERERGFI